MIAKIIIATIAIAAVSVMMVPVIVLLYKTIKENDKLNKELENMQ